MCPGFRWRTGMKAQFSKSVIVQAIAAAFLVGVTLPGHAQSPGSDNDRGHGAAGTAAGGASGTGTSSNAGASSGADSGAGSRSGAGFESGNGSQPQSRPARIENR